VYLSNDKAERKASGSYYTPDPIVEYIVAQTVGPVLEEKLERLRPEFRKVRKTFDRQLANARDPRIHSPANQQRDVRAEAADKTYAEHRGLVEVLFAFRVLDPAMGTGQVGSFVDAVSKGGSANLGAAIVGMGRCSEADRNLALDFSWARSRPLPPTVFQSKGTSCSGDHLVSGRA
jgi:hypothetical protein